LRYSLRRDFAQPRNLTRPPQIGDDLVGRHT
jgi:hypothetical protein